MKIVLNTSLIYNLGNSDVVNFFVETNDGIDRRLNVAIFVFWSICYVLAESLECEGSNSSSSFYWQSANYYSHVYQMCQTQNLNYIACINFAAHTNYSTCTDFLCKVCI